MPSPDWEVLDDFLSLNEFAVKAIIKPQSGDEFAVLGIFDDPYLNAEIGEYELDSSRPRLTCKERDVVGVLRGDVVDIDGVLYDVMSGPQSDGTGMALLDLAMRHD